MRVAQRGAAIGSASSARGALLFVVDCALGRIVSLSVHGVGLTRIGLPPDSRTMQGIAADLAAKGQDREKFLVYGT